MAPAAGLFHTAATNSFGCGWTATLCGLMVPGTRCTASDVLPTSTGRSLPLACQPFTGDLSSPVFSVSSCTGTAGPAAANGSPAAAGVRPSTAAHRVRKGAFSPPALATAAAVALGSRAKSAAAARYLGVSAKTAA